MGETVKPAFWTSGLRLSIVLVFGTANGARATNSAVVVSERNCTEYYLRRDQGVLSVHMRMAMFVRRSVIRFLVRLIALVRGVIGVNATRIVFQAKEIMGSAKRSFRYYNIRQRWIFKMMSLKAAIRCNYTHDEIEKQECNTEHCAIDCKR